VARNTYEAWIPEQWGGAVIQRIQAMSAVEAVARREPMSTDTKHVPRENGVDVQATAKGVAYGEDEGVNDEVLLTARKMTRAIRIAEEDLKDTAGVANILETKKRSWATSYAKYYDNATIAVTLAESMPAGRPFTSLYYALTQNNAATGYTANTNIEQSGGTVSYDLLSQIVGKYEDSEYFDDASSVVLASPVFRGLVREVKDGQQRPIFVQGTSGTPDTLFNIPIKWTSGLRTATVATRAPAGNPLLVVGNREFLVIGDRSGPESRVIPAEMSNTDEALLMMRARKGFTIGHEKAFSVLEHTEDES